MSDISILIKSYLKNKESDYAIMIDGQWGSGKTYYWKSNLAPMISKQVFNTEKTLEESSPRIYYDPVYVSLFGLNNIDELGRRIFVELNPFWKKKSGKVISNIGKLAINKTINYFGIDSLKSSEIHSIVNSLEISENKVICLDDLERLSPNLLNELFGFINLFTEHDHLKVIILSDEKIIRDKSDEYNKIKEKIIRFTYVYHPEIKSIYSAIFEKINVDEYKSFMESRMDFVCGLYLKANYKNIRTLKFNLELFEEIHSKLLKISNNKHYEIVLDRFLYFLTTYCIEYKTELKEENLNKLKGYSNVNLISFNQLDQDFKILNPNKEEGRPTTTYLENFKEKYTPYGNTKYAYYECIAEYVHSGVLDSKELNSIAEEIVNQLVINDKTKEIDISQQLNNIYNLEDNQIIPLIEKVLAKIGEGEYQLVTYPNIFFTLLRIEHMGINEFKVDEGIIDKFKIGIEKAKKLSNYVNNFDIHIPIFESPDTKYGIIKDLAISANNSLKNVKIKEYSEKIIKAFDVANSEGVFDFITDSKYQFEPILSFIDPNIFLKKLSSLSNADKWRVYEAFNERYSYSNSSSSLKKEVSFFTELKKLIDEEIAKYKVKDVSTEIYRQLSSFIDQLVNRPN